MNLIITLRINATGEYFSMKILEFGMDQLIEIIDFDTKNK